MPDFLIRAHRRRDGCGVRRSHQIDRRPPFVRMGPAVSARALTIGQGRAIKRCTALPFPCSTSLAQRCGVAVHRRPRPHQMLAGPVHVRRTCATAPGQTYCPVLPYTASPPNHSGSYSFPPTDGAHCQRVLPTSSLNTNNFSQSLRGCLEPSSQISWAGCAGTRSRRPPAPPSAREAAPAPPAEALAGPAICHAK
jgi:hypothetical protein